MQTVCSIKIVLAQLQPELVRSYDKYLLTGGVLSLEEYRLKYFPSHPAIQREVFSGYELKYKLYRRQHPTTTMTFSSYVRSLIKYEPPPPTPPEPTQPRIEEVEEEEEEAPPTRALPSSTRVNVELLNRWSKTGIKGMSNDAIRDLEESMKSICRASTSISGAQPFDEANPPPTTAAPAIRSSCDWHKRLHHTHHLETTQNPHLAEGAGPSHLVFHRHTPSRAGLGIDVAGLGLDAGIHAGADGEEDDDMVSEELVHSGELDEDNMLIQHTFVNSSGLFDWVKKQVARFTGRALPKGLIEFFQDSENFAAAVELAEQVFMLNGKELSSADVKKNLGQLTQEQLDLLFAFTQYLCYVTKRTNIRKPSSGTCSLQKWHEKVCCHGGHELKDASAIAQKIVRCGLGSLTRNEKRVLLCALQEEEAPLPSSANIVSTKYSTVPTANLDNLKGWERRKIKQKMIQTLQTYQEQLRKGIVLPPALTLEEALQPDTLPRSLFLQDLKAAYGKRLSQATQGVGVWLVPTNADYRVDTHKPDAASSKSEKRRYFTHFFVDMNPESELGKLNRTAASSAQRRKKSSIILVTNASRRIRSSQLFPTPLLRNDLHTTLYAILADPDPSDSKTLAVQLEQLPRSLFEKS